MPGIDLLQAGCYAPPPGPWAGNSGVTPIATRAFVLRFVPHKAMTITKIAFAVITAASVDDPCEVGIYDSMLATLLGTSGSQSGLMNSLGAKAPSLLTPVSLVAGQVYYGSLAYGTVGGTAASIFATGPNSPTAQIFGNAPPYVEQGWSNGRFPLPSAFGGLSSIPTQAPILAMVP